MIPARGAAWNYILMQYKHLYDTHNHAREHRTGCESHRRYDAAKRVRRMECMRALDRVVARTGKLELCSPAVSRAEKTHYPDRLIHWFSSRGVGQLLHQVQQG